jgi:hypothetical protein
VSLYFCVLRLLNREIGVFNYECKQWMDDLQQTDGGVVNDTNSKLINITMWHSKLCQSVRVADEMFASFSGFTIAFLTTVSTITTFVVLTSDALFGIAAASLPMLVFYLYSLFRLVHQASMVHHKVFFFLYYIYSLLFSL